MLAMFFRLRLFFLGIATKCIVTSVIFSSLHAYEKSWTPLQHQHLLDRPLEDLPKATQRYFYSIDENTPLEEAVEFLVSLRIAIKQQGYEVPRLEDMLIYAEDFMNRQGIIVSQDLMEKMKNICNEKEFGWPPKGCDQQLDDWDSWQISSKKKKKQKQIEMSDNMAIGFCEVIAGALLCIIPHPLTLGIGSGLILHGGGQIIGEVADESKKERERRERDEIKRQIDESYVPFTPFHKGH